jgi:hypothetical protein
MLQKLTSVNGKRSSQGDASKPNPEDESSSNGDDDNKDMNVQNNPLVQLLMGAGMQPHSPALRMNMQIGLYPLDPGTLRSLIDWQQQHGILPRCGPCLCALNVFQQAPVPR